MKKNESPKPPKSPEPKELQIVTTSLEYKLGDRVVGRVYRGEAHTRDTQKWYASYINSANTEVQVPRPGPNSYKDIEEASQQLAIFLQYYYGTSN